LVKLALKPFLINFVFSKLKHRLNLKLGEYKVNLNMLHYGPMYINDAALTLIDNAILIGATPVYVT